MFDWDVDRRSVRYGSEVTFRLIQYDLQAGEKPGRIRLWPGCHQLDHEHRGGQRLVGCVGEQKVMRE